MTEAVDRALDLLDRVLASYPQAESRDGQREMVAHVAEAIESGSPVVVQAGTGTGKTLGYLVPVLAARQTAVIATFTKALQDQLAMNDLPLLQQVLTGDETFVWAVLKGRNNYLCRQRLSETSAVVTQESLTKESEASNDVDDQLRALHDWSQTTECGDVAKVPFPVSDSVWRRVSVGSDECPGKSRCAFGDTCFTEAARERARLANIVVVNFSLYGLHVQHDHDFLPPHDVVVFDEAHELEDVICDTASITITARAVLQAAEAARLALSKQKTVNALVKSASVLDEVLAAHLGSRLSNPPPSDVSQILSGIALQSSLVSEALRALPEETPEMLRAQNLINRLHANVSRLAMPDGGSVCYVTEVRNAARLIAAPLRVDEVLQAVWGTATPVLTSATIPPLLPRRLGLPIDDDQVHHVKSPFDYERQSLMYLADDLPDPSAASRRDALSRRIRELLLMSNGSALILFTSWGALHDTYDDLRSESLPFNLYVQDQMPKQLLIETFRADQQGCLLATRGFFQGVDLPGETLRLVIIDKVPFPALRDPLLDARREFVGPGAFGLIDIPIAAASLAQAAGRLIRSQNDHGVVAILDPRLARKGYKDAVLSGLRHLPETSRLAEVEEFFDRRAQASGRNR